MASMLPSSAAPCTATVLRSSFTSSLPAFSRSSRTSHARCSYRSTLPVIRAAKLPSGVEAPKEEPKLPTALWGFTENAERWNSRAAMIGLFGLFFFELFIQKGFLQLIGFEVGKGLDLPL